jgi:hypothetical protein
LIRHGIAHEVGHIKQDVLGRQAHVVAKEKIISKAYVAWEHEASVFAKWASGLSAKEAQKAIDKINAMSIKKFGISILNVSLV